MDLKRRLSRYAPPGMASEMKSVIGPIHTLGHHNIRTTEDNKFAIVDVFVAMGISNNTNNAGLKLRRLMQRNEEVRDVVSEHKFPGHGQRSDTKVASRRGLVAIFMTLEGKTFEKYRKNASEIMLRAFDGDDKLADEILEIHREQGDCEENKENWTRLKDMDFEVVDETKETNGVVYLAGSDIMSCFKVGMWRGDAGSLLARYKTYYGPRTWIRTWETDDVVLSEKIVLGYLSAFCIGGELFSLQAYEFAVKFLSERFTEIL